MTVGEEGISASGPLGTYMGLPTDVSLDGMRRACLAVGLLEWGPMVPDAPGWWWRHDHQDPEPTLVWAVEGALIWSTGSHQRVVEDDGDWGGPYLPSRRG